MHRPGASFLSRVVLHRRVAATNCQAGLPSDPKTAAVEAVFRWLAQVVGYSDAGMLGK